MEKFSKHSLLFLFSFIVVAQAQKSPYFLETGANSAAQEIREIKSPGSYLVIAIAPGFEDLASVANFGIGEGAAVSVAFVTNGEDIPSDLNGETFSQLAARRKEEAYRALSHLGVQSYFLNIPINQFLAGANCFKPTSELDEKLAAGFDSLVSQVKPDVIVLDGDPLSGTNQSTRLAYLEDFVAKGIRAEKSTSSWSVKRLFVQTNERIGSVVIPVGRKDPVWSRNYLEMAREAERSYATLKYQIRLWDRNRSHRYIQLYPADRNTVRSGGHIHSVAKTPFPLDTGLPELGKGIKALLPLVNSVSSIQKVPDREARLAIVRTVIAKVDAFTYRYQYSLDESDLRVLTTWKLGLEKFRCAILGVSITYAISDTIITPIQVFFLKFGKPESAFTNGKTQLLFPGVVQKQWVVNEYQKEFYNWDDTTAFRVLSPREISLNSPETPSGFEAIQVRTPFVFIVAHQDSNPNHDFMYREEIPLIIAPYRSIEVLTPQVAMSHDTSLCIRFRSNVRDKAGGFFYVDDSVVSSPKDSVKMPGKNYVVTDTLPLFWKDTSIAMPREVKVWASDQIAIASFVVRSLDAKCNIKKKVGLCSMIENGPLQIAIKRLGISPTVLDGTSPLDLSQFSTIIIDQFSVAKFFDIPFQLGSVDRWIKDGGRLIVFPQYQCCKNNMPSIGSDRFIYLPTVGCNEKVEFDSSAIVFNSPNKIGERDFDGDSFALSYGEIRDQAESDSRVLMRSGARILLLDIEMGKGSIFLCGLNLLPRLLEINQAAYRLLANLLN